MATNKNKSINTLLIWCSGVLYGANFWYRSSFGPITDVLASEFNATSGQIGFISALFWFGYVLPQIPSGLFLQYVTAEFSIIISGCLFALSSFLFAIASYKDSVLFPSIAMVLSGIASAPVLLAMFKLIAETMGVNQVPFIGGAISFMAGMLEATGNQLQAYLYQEHGIWREMYIGCASVVFVATIILYTLAVTKYSKYNTTAMQQTNKEINPRTPLRLHPFETTSNGSSTDSTPDGSIYCCKILVIESETMKESTSFRHSAFVSMKSAFSNPWNYIVGLHWFTVISIQSFNGLWLRPYLSVKFGYDRETATAITIMYIGAHAVGLVVLGALSTKLMRRKIFYIISSMGLLNSLYIIYCGPDADMIVISCCNVICGFCSGMAPIVLGVTREYNDCNGCSDIAGGIVNSIGLLLGGTGMQWIMGMLIDYSCWTRRGGGYDEEEQREYSVADYDLAFVVIPAVLLLNWCLTLMLKETKGKMIQWDRERACFSRYFRQQY